MERNALPFDTAICDGQSARSHFLRYIRQMEHAGVLMRRSTSGAMEVAYFSAAFAGMLGRSEEGIRAYLQGHSYLDAIYPEDQLLVKRMLRRRVSDDGGKDLAVRLRTSQEDLIWCRAYFAFIDDFGEHYVYISLFDISKMMEYERRLRTSYMSMGESFYQANERTLGLFRINLSRDKIEDMQGRDLYGTDSMVRAWTEVLLWRAEHYPIQREREALLSAFQPAKLIERYMQGQAQQTMRLYSRRRDGHFCYVDLTAALTRHPLTGEMVAFVAEQEANDDKVGEMLIGKILARQFDMVSYLSEGLYGVVVGDAALIEKGSIFPLERNGLYQSYLENQVFPVLYGSEEEKRLMREGLSLGTVRERLKEKEPYIVNIQCRIDGERYFKRFDFYNVDPDADFYILLKSDTTSIQKEQMARNEQLRLALEEAKQANVAKTAFLSRMSHEIRTPMNAIIGLDNIAMQEEGLSQGMRGHLEKIGDSARYLLSLINDILDMSRIESGRMTVRNEEFSFHGFLDQINTMVDSQCRDRGLRFDCVLHGAFRAYYIGDEMKLKQVLINILGNAVKFTEPGGRVSMDVECIGSYQGQAGLRFTISDTGVGMDQDYLPHIFDAFSQEDGTTTSSYGGSGLGMAITKNIVELLNGSIQVASEKGVGSTFTVEVSLKEGRQDAPEGKEQEEQGQEGEARKDVDLTGCRVLLAEDVPVNAEIMKELLKMCGMEVDHAENGQLAVEAFSEKPEGYYDAVLMDVRMPVMDGLEAARQIRALSHPDGHLVPIIAMTANAFDEDVQRSLQAGMDAHLSKPVEPERMFRTLEELIARRRERDENGGVKGGK